MIRNKDKSVLLIHLASPIYQAIMEPFFQKHHHPLILVGRLLKDILSTKLMAIDNNNMKEKMNELRKK